jgi:hypothetical protein
MSLNKKAALKQRGFSYTLILFYQLKSLSHFGVISDVALVLLLLGADSLFLKPPESFDSFELEN